MLTRLEVSQGNQTAPFRMLVWNSNVVFKTCRFFDIRL